MLDDDPVVLEDNPEVLEDNAGVVEDDPNVLEDRTEVLLLGNTMTDVATGEVDAASVLLGFRDVKLVVIDSTTDEACEVPVGTIGSSVDEIATTWLVAGRVGTAVVEDPTTDDSKLDDGAIADRRLVAGELVCELVGSNGDGMLETIVVVMGSSEDVDKKLGKTVVMTGNCEEIG